MASLSQFLLWGCVLCFCTQVPSQNTTVTLESKNLTCDYKIRVIFTTDRWASEMDDTIQDQIFFGLMEKMAASANEAGVNCTSDESSNELICCNSGNWDNYQQKRKQNWANFHYILGYDILYISIAFLVLNLFFFVYVIIWGFIQKISYSGSFTRARLPESIEMT